MQPVRVKILDSEYLIKSDEEEEKVHQIAEYVNEKLKEIKENVEGLSEKRAAILAALNIASDYFQLVKAHEELTAQIRERTGALIRHIDSIMG